MSEYTTPSYDPAYSSYNNNQRREVYSNLRNYTPRSLPPLPKEDDHKYSDSIFDDNGSDNDDSYSIICNSGCDSDSDDELPIIQAPNIPRNNHEINYNYNDFSMELQNFKSMNISSAGESAQSIYSDSILSSDTSNSSLDSFNIDRYSRNNINIINDYDQQTEFSMQSHVLSTYLGSKNNYIRHDSIEEVGRHQTSDDAQTLFYPKQRNSKVKKVVEPSKRNNSQPHPILILAKEENNTISQSYPCTSPSEIGRIRTLTSQTPIKPHTQFPNNYPLEQRRYGSAPIEYRKTVYRDFDAILQNKPSINNKNNGNNFNKPVDISEEEMAIAGIPPKVPKHQEYQKKNPVRLRCSYRGTSPYIATFPDMDDEPSDSSALKIRSGINPNNNNIDTSKYTRTYSMAARQRLSKSSDLKKKIPELKESKSIDIHNNTNQSKNKDKYQESDKSKDCLEKQLQNVKPFMLPGYSERNSNLRVINGSCSNRSSMIFDNDQNLLSTKSTSETCDQKLSGNMRSIASDDIDIQINTNLNTKDKISFTTNSNSLNISKKKYIDINDDNKFKIKNRITSLTILNFQDKSQREAIWEKRGEQFRAISECYKKGSRVPRILLHPENDIANI